MRKELSFNPMSINGVDINLYFVLHFIIFLDRLFFDLLLSLFLLYLLLLFRNKFILRPLFFLLILFVDGHNLIKSIVPFDCIVTQCFGNITEIDEGIFYKLHSH